MPQIEHDARQHSSADLDAEAIRELGDIAQAATACRDLLVHYRRVQAVA